MNWIDIFVLIVLGLSFLGGLKNGLFKSVASLVALVIAIPLAGRFYFVIAAFLTFLPVDWQGFISFYVALGIVSAILHIIFFLPRKLVEGLLGEGLVSRFLGGVVSILNAAIGLAVFVRVLAAFPIIGWLAEYVAGSALLTGLTGLFSFVAVLLPEAMRRASGFSFFL